MKQVVIAYVLFSLLMIGSVQAQDLVLEYYGIEDIINDDLSVDNIITLKFGKPVPSLDYQLGFFIDNLTVKNNFEVADCDYENNVAGSIISCVFAGMTYENDLLQLSFTTSDSVKKLGENNRFSINYGISLPVDRVFVRIRLPEKATLPEQVVNQSFFPHDGQIASDGKRIMVYWEQENLTSGDNLQYSILYSTPSATLSNMFIFSVAAIIIIFMVAVAVYVKRGSRKEYEVIKSVLNQDENTIVKLLVNKEGSSVQKALVRETDFSKAKVSRIVKNLKQRGIVDIEAVSGRENRVVLKVKNIESDKEQS